MHMACRRTHEPCRADARTVASLLCEGVYRSLDGGYLFGSVGLLLAFEGNHLLGGVGYETLVGELLLHSGEEAFVALEFLFEFGEFLLHIDLVGKGNAVFNRTYEECHRSGALLFDRSDGADVAHLQEHGIKAAVVLACSGQIFLQA